MSTNRNAGRAAYQRRYYHLKKAYWALAPDHPDVALSWNEYLTKHAHATAGKARGPYTDPSTWTPRQSYQATYQAAYRKAQNFYGSTPRLRGQYPTFSAYWKAMKHTYLPDSFLKRQDGHLVRKYNQGRVADRNNYQTAYREARRRWDGFCVDRAAFKHDWAIYWAHIKAAGFTTSAPPITHQPQRAPVAVLLDGVDNIEENSEWVIAG